MPISNAVIFMHVVDAVMFMHTLDAVILMHILHSASPPGGEAGCMNSFMFLFKHVLRVYLCMSCVQTCVCLVRADQFVWCACYVRDSVCVM